MLIDALKYGNFDFLEAKKCDIVYIILMYWKNKVSEKLPEGHYVKFFSAANTASSNNSLEPTATAFGGD